MKVERVQYIYEIKRGYAIGRSRSGLYRCYRAVFEAELFQSPRMSRRKFVRAGEAQAYGVVVCGRLRRWAGVQQQKNPRFSA